LASERTSTAISFLFFCFDLVFLKRVQSSEPINTKLPLIFSFFDRRLLLNPFFLLAGALLFDEKIRCTIWFGMWDVRILQIFYSRAVVHRTSVDSPAFLETGLAEKIAVCAHTTPSAEEIGGLEFFFAQAAQNFDFFQMFKIRIKKSKTYKGLCPFQGLSNGIPLRLIQSGRTVPLTHFLFLSKG
jgi:hypothetical protein